MKLGFKLDDVSRRAFTAFCLDTGLASFIKGAGKNTSQLVQQHPFGGSQFSPIAPSPPATNSQKTAGIGRFHEKISIK